jgi:hypothetical protein
VPLSRVVLAAEKCQLYTARMPVAAATTVDTTDTFATASTAVAQPQQQQQQQQPQQPVGRTSLLRKAIVLSDSSLSSPQHTTDATSPRVSSKAVQLQQQQKQQCISGARLYHMVWPFSCSFEHSLTTPTTNTDDVSAAVAAVASSLLHTVSVKADLIQARLFLDTRLPEAVYTQVVQPLLDGIAAMNQQNESDIPVKTEPMTIPVPITSTTDGVTATGIVVSSDSNNHTVTIATSGTASAASSSSSSSTQVSLVSHILACSSGHGTLVSGGVRITVVNNLYRQSAPVANFRVFDVEGALRLTPDKHAAHNQGKSNCCTLIDS